MISGWLSERRLADFWTRAGAETFGDGMPQLDAVRRAARVSLRVGVGTTNSTPCNRASIMLLTAFPPAPPTPKTTMRGFRS